MLLLRRCDAGHYWALPGGRVEAGETEEEAARRELAEETGVAFTGTLRPWTRRVKDGVDFTTFIGEAPEEFVPVLNEEHDLYQWSAPDQALELGALHPGLNIALLRFDLDELGVARAMRIGELTSPQRYGNVLLIALRISGTGISYRTRSKEYVWRDPSLYLTDEMLARCNGLPVVVEHPDADTLDSTEFHERMVGSIFLPYIQGDEVWGIAKIYDDVAANMLEALPLSTSPGVVTGGTRERLPDGSMILVESEPSLVDHLAICMLGVWDKGGPAAGVLNQSQTGETTMAKETVKDDEGKPIDRVLDHLESLHGKIDGLATRVDSIEAKKDADEKAEKDAAEEQAKKDAEEKAEKDAAEEKARLDALPPEEKEKAEKDAAEEKAKKDAEEKARKDAEEKAEKDAEEKAMKDSVDLKEMKTRLDAFEGRLKEPTPEERQRFVAAQVKAECVHQAFGDSAGAPRAVAGESLLGYRKRLLTPHKVHSKAWKNVNIEAITDEATLGIAEDQIFADAMTVAMHPVLDSAEPTLRAQVTTDDTGRKITRFVGHPEACWGAFKSARKAVIGFQTQDRK